MYKIEWATSTGVYSQGQIDEHDTLFEAVNCLGYLYSTFTGHPEHDCFLAYLSFWKDDILIEEYESDWYKYKNIDQKKLEAFDKIAAIFKEF